MHTAETIKGLGVSVKQLPMLNLEKCKKILQEDGKTYTDEEIKQIRHQLYKLANLEYQLYNNLKVKSDGKLTTVCKG